MFNLTFPDYSHQQAYHYFSNEIYTSLNYLLDFYQLPEIKSSLPLSWETCAIHYIAAIYAESEEHSTSITYLNQLKREDSRQQLTISPLSSDDSSFAAHIILKIIRDDKQLGFGYCDDNQLATDETLKIKEALALIYRYVPDSGKEINQFIHQIYLTQETKDGSRFMRSGTNFYMWGMLFAYIHPSHSVAYYIDILAHECGHTALNILNAQDQLVSNSPDDVFTAPLRDDDRPMIGIFHALFVLSRICHVFDEIIKKNSDECTDEYNERFTESLKKLRNTANIVKQHAVLTDTGRAIFSEICQRWNLN